MVCNVLALNTQFNLVSSWVKLLIICLRTDEMMHPMQDQHCGGDAQITYNSWRKLGWFHGLSTSKMRNQTSGFVGGKTTSCLTLIAISFGYHTSVTSSHSYHQDLRVAVIWLSVISQHIASYNTVRGYMMLFDFIPVHFSILTFYLYNQSTH